MFELFAERIRTEVARCLGEGGRVPVTWATQAQPVGSAVRCELEVTRNREVIGEPRTTAPADPAGAVRTLHQQRELWVLCKVLSKAPAVAGKDRGAPYAKSAQTLLERVTARLQSAETRETLVPGECSYEGAGDIMSVFVAEDGKRVDAAVSELRFLYAGADETGEDQGAIESLEVTSELEDAAGDPVPGGWDGHLIEKP